MHDIFTCCCNEADCIRLQEFNESYKRIENDAHLAAEIGQALLQEKNGELDYELYKDNYDELKKLRWENEQSNEMINLLKSEIKFMTSTSNELKKKINDYEQEIQKNKLCEKLLSLKVDIEQELKTQISDLKQELSHLKKSENNIILKYKHLNSKYETLQLTHEVLVEEHDQFIRSKVEKLIVSLEQEPAFEKNNISPAKIVIPEAIPNHYRHHHKKASSQFKMTTTNNNKNPFDVLQSVTQQTFDKISATDTRILNRRLKRAFDMTELSELSNSILANILNHITDDFTKQFDWAQDYHTEHFFPLMLLIRDLLKELGTTKMTLNDLQADYVRRIMLLSATHTIQEKPISSNKSFMQGLLSLFTLH